MSSINFLPSLGSTGRWTLTAPYSNLVLATARYECIAIVKLAGAVAQGLDPLTNVYKANNDVETSFNRDLDNDDYLVTIKSGPGDIVTFPRSAMTGLPDAGGVIYRNTMIGISLSSLPDTIDLTTMGAQLQALVLNTLGVRSSVYYTQIGSSTILTDEQSAALEAARETIITSPDSVMWRNAQLQEQNDALIDRLAMLEAFIALHFVPPP